MIVWYASSPGITVSCWYSSICMMTSSDGNIFRVNGPLGRASVDSPHKGPVMRSVDVLFDLRLNKRLSKQSRRRWIETPSYSSWRQCNGTAQILAYLYCTTWANPSYICCFVIYLACFIFIFLLSISSRVKGYNYPLLRLFSFSSLILHCSLCLYGTVF